MRSDCERTETIADILSLIVAPFYGWFGCTQIATKAAVYAVDRIEALRKIGFEKSDRPMIGEHDIAYYDYWMIQAP